jgi:osmotically-inducible protein OsmY
MDWLELSDRELSRHAHSALVWEPALDERDIAVSVDHGVAFLKGTVRSDVERTTAEQVVLSIYGVRGVVNSLNVCRW